jgi:hypothetical protein
MLYHLGGAPSQQSLLAVFPTRHTALVVLTNCAVGHALHAAVLARALEMLFGMADPPIPRTIGLARSALAEYEGRFVGTDANLVVTASDAGIVLEVENRGAYAERPTSSPARARFWFSPDHAVGVDGWAKGQYGDFLRDRAGSVQYFRWGVRLRARPTRNVYNAAHR